MELYSMLCGSLDGFWGRMNTCVCMTESLLPVNQLCVCMQNHFSHVWFFVTVWTVVHQALLSMGFSRQEHWSGLLFPSPGDLPNSGVEPVSLASPALRQILYHWATREATIRCISIQNGKFKFWKKNKPHWPDHGPTHLCKGPESKHFWICRPYNLCCKHINHFRLYIHI